ncbi:uncharacterized protein A4U43_C05F1040 [Asparagus officinalis]|uniref:Uncharacterized protein n=1 Tax=Asparagus officinalis TaxID=4686 RepID=A0A5P1EP22_ASPOF|nr:uncharacterized protein A4U43_C05F1040 [Asparagus officinalis]
MRKEQYENLAGAGARVWVPNDSGLASEGPRMPSHGSPVEADAEGRSSRGWQPKARPGRFRVARRGFEGSRIAASALPMDTDDEVYRAGSPASGRWAMAAMSGPVRAASGSSARCVRRRAQATVERAPSGAGSWCGCESKAGAFGAKKRLMRV